MISVSLLTFKKAVPTRAPTHCTIIYSNPRMIVILPVISIPAVTAGFT